jgi:hypothetical protein
VISPSLHALSVAVASSTGHSSCSSSTAKTQARCTAASLRKRAVAAWTDASEAFAKLGLNSTQLFYRGAAAAHQDQNQRRPQNQRADGGRVGEQFAHSRAPGGPVEDTPDKDLDQLVGGLVQASVGTMAPRRVRFGKAAGSIIGHGRGCAPPVISLAPRPAAPGNRSGRAHARVTGASFHPRGRAPLPERTQIAPVDSAEPWRGTEGRATLPTPTSAAVTSCTRRRRLAHRAECHVRSERARHRARARSGDRCHGPTRVMCPRHDSDRWIGDRTPLGRGLLSARQRYPAAVALAAGDAI